MGTQVVAGGGRRIEGTGLGVHLLGRPRLDMGDAPGYRYRSRKSWAVLTLLLLGERAPTRSHLASLLFAEADDPLRALRWSLAEIRRGLGPSGLLGGDPVRLRLPPGARVDVRVLLRGSWSDAVTLPGLGSDLLDGVHLTGAESFESWLLSQRRRVAAATETILHEAALGQLARGGYEAARGYAVRAAMMNPLDENHQALLIRIYRLAGDDSAADEQFSSWATTAERELGTAPGPAARLALRARRRSSTEPADPASIDALTEAASAAVSAGAFDAGITSLELAGELADRSGADRLRVETRLIHAEALIHVRGGLDEKGAAILTEAEEIASATGDREALTRIRAEMGYVDFLRARYERAERLFGQVLTEEQRRPSTTAKALAYLGSVTSDQGDYPRAVATLEEATWLSHEIAEPRREAYALSMLGRVSWLIGRYDDALDQLRASLELAQREHWVSFLAWPQAWIGQVLLSQGDLNAAADNLEQSFARACQVGDPCWEGISARGLALLTAARGDVETALATLVDARSRANRLTDPYTWLDVHILDALCLLGRRHRDPRTAGWVGEMRERASRTGMRELMVRAMLHSAALGDHAAGEMVRLLTGDVDNTRLMELFDTDYLHDEHVG